MATVTLRGTGFSATVAPWRKPDGPITPENYPHDVIRVACDKCGREGRYPRADIIARFGRDAAMPDVLRELAMCAQWSNAGDPCGARFPDLGSG